MVIIVVRRWLTLFALITISTETCAIEDVIVQSGKMLKIACIATKIESTGRCNWKTNHGELLHDTATVKPNSNFAIVGDIVHGDCSLLISSISIKDTGVWTCTFLPNIVKAFNVTVTGESEELVMLFKNKVVADGQKILIDPEQEEKQRFTCMIELVVGNPTFKWYIDGLGPQPAKEKKPSSGTAPHSKRFDSTLSITPPELVSGISDKLKTVKCIASFSSGDTKTLEEYVTIGSKNPVTMVEGTVVEHEEVEDEAIADIYCQSDGHPRPNSHDYAILFQRNKAHAWEIAVQSQNFSAYQEGNYVCLIQSEDMKDNNTWISSKIMTIGKEVPVHFAILYQHSSGSINCNSDIYSERCIWSKGNTVIAGSAIPTYKEKYVITGNATEGDCTLAISDVTQEDHGVWRCQFFPPGEPVKQDFNVVVV